MADTGAPWTTIESDPGVFTELMEAMGVPGVQMEELYSLDADSLKTMKPVHGLIFLFRWTPEAGADDRAVASEAETPPGLFFARQVATNACATQAILSILLNRPGKVTLGGAAATLKEFCAGLPPDVAGLALASCDPVREAHNSFAPPSSLVQEDKKAPSDEDAFHFVAYLPFAGSLWELDGLRKGPIKLCDLSSSQGPKKMDAEGGGAGGEEAAAPAAAAAAAAATGEATTTSAEDDDDGDGDGDWLDRVGPFIQERIAKHAASEVRFNLMAVVGSRLAAAEERVRRAEEAVAASSASPASPASAAAAANDGLVAARASLASERDRRARWAAENERRKHNLLPFMFELLRSLAERGKLSALIEEARKPSTRRRRRRGGGGDDGGADEGEQAATAAAAAGGGEKETEK